MSIGRLNQDGFFEVDEDLTALAAELERVTAERDQAREEVRLQKVQLNAIGGRKPEDSFRVGRHQARNLYRGDTYIGVCFDEQDAALVVAALNGHRPAASHAAPAEGWVADRQTPDPAITQPRSGEAQKARPLPCGCPECARYAQPHSGEVCTDG